MVRLALVLLIVTATPATAQTPAHAWHEQGLKNWIPSQTLPGAERMPLVGDLAKAEQFVVRFKYPHDYYVPPHFHTATVTIVVLKGTLVAGMGEKVDTAAVQRYGVGSFLLLPANMNHYEWTEGETVLHVQGLGPFATKFLDPNETRRIGRPR